MQGESGDRCSSPDPPGYDSDEDADEVVSVSLVVQPSHLMNELALRLEKQQFGQISFTPGSKNLLNDMLDEVYAQLQPKSTDWDARQTVITFITKFIHHKLPGSSISAFGSFVMDLFTSSSDLDLSLNLLDGKCDRSRNDQVHCLRKVAKALYQLQNGQRQSVRGIETVYRAAVPVVKFVECKTGIECDISVENNDGVLKSQVLRMFSTMDSRFRQLCYLVKAWAKKHNVNSSKNGTLNSLSICLLVAFHLQTLPTPIIPPFSIFMEGLHLPAIGSCLETVASRVKNFKDRGFGKDNTESVPELFGSFFLKLIAVENLWEKGLCSSTYEGRWISKIWPKNHIGCISVEDFADRTQNVARSVSRKEFDLIYQALVSTVSNLRDPVSDVLEAKDLKAYLFGSIRHRRRGLDHAELTPFNMGNWQGGSSWFSGERRFHVTKSRVSEPLPDNSQYADQIWGQTGLGTVHFSQFHGQAGRGPGHRAHMYRKVGHSNGVPKVDPNFDVIGHGDDRGLHQPQHYERAYDYRPQYPRLESRPNPPSDNIKQMPLHASSGYFSTGAGNSKHRKEEFSGRHRKDDVTTENTSNQSEGGYIHKDVDFPSIGIGYVAVEEPAPVERITYAAVGSRPRLNHCSTSPTVQSNLQQQQSIQHQGTQGVQQQSVQQQSIQQSIRQQSIQQQSMQQQSIQQSTQQQTMQKQSNQLQSIQQQSFQQQSSQHQSIQQQSIQPQIIQHQSIAQQSIQHHCIPQHSIQQHSFHQHNILQHSDQQHTIQHNQRYRHRNGRRGGWAPHPTVADNAHQYYANGYQIPNGGNVNWQAHPPPSSQFLIS